LVGGFGEFAEKYFELMTDLAARGFAVWFLDWRGQGGSARSFPDPSRPRARDYDRDVADLAAFAARYLPEHARRVVVGHAMGGAIALLALTQRTELFDAAVLSAPMLGLVTRPVPGWLAPAFAAVPAWCGLGTAFAPGRGPWQIDPQIATRNPATRDPVRAGVQQAWCLASPRLRLDGPTYGWMHAAFGLTRRLDDPDLLRLVRAPVLLGCPMEDAYVDPLAIQRAATVLPKGELTVFASARHELFMETESVRGRWLAAIESFLQPVLNRARGGRMRAAGRSLAPVR
jgi:lysophospholipase